MINLISNTNPFYYLKEKIESCKCGFNFISEYNIKWNTYLDTLHELTEDFADIIDLFN